MRGADTFTESLFTMRVDIYTYNVRIWAYNYHMDKQMLVHRSDGFRN